MHPLELRDRREALHLTQAELARALGVARNTVARWERGELAMRQPEVVALALERLETVPAASRALPGPAKLVHNVPADLTSFVGRGDELREYHALLETTRLLTLTGVGGTGKTRLAQRLARDVLDDYRDGAWFVDLARIASPLRVTQAVAAVFGLHEQSGCTLLATVAAALSRRQALLVLDNCEHVLDAAAELATALLRAAPGLKILATSRAPLGLRGETTRVVAPLPVPQRGHVPWEQLLQVPSVRLLVERAAGHAAFEADARDASALAEICWRLDGLPLALEMAAARLAIIGPTELASRLNDTFQVLVGPQRDAPARHHTLRATLDWSHSLLSPAEQQLFARLAVFAGGWTLEACEQVATGDGIDAPEVLDLLSALVAKSLVVAEPTPGGRVRYRFLEMVRQYARERLLELPGFRAVRARHRDWFFVCAERFNNAVHGPMEATEFARLDADLDNLRAALEWSVADGSDLDRSLVVAGHLWWFWQAHGYSREGREYAEHLLARAGPDTTPAARADALIGAGMLAWNQSGPEDLVVACEQMSEAAAIARDLGDKHLLINALAGLVRPVRDRGDLVLARRLLGETIELAEAIGDRWRQARSLNFLGIMAVAEGDFARAAEWYEQSLVRSQELGDDFGVATQLGNLGLLAYRQRNLELAVELLCRAISMRRDQGAGFGLSLWLEACAGVAGAYRWGEQAARLYGVADAVRERRGEASEWRRHHNFEQRYRQDVAAARSRLGAAAFGQARVAGRDLSLDQALGEISAMLEAVRASPKRSDRSELTRRESEVARLVARGLTNQQIAVQLVFTEATAAKHVEHILDRLGFTSRAQIAAWVAAASPELLAPTAI